MPPWPGCMRASRAFTCQASRLRRPTAHKGIPMPRFAANLPMMFNEHAFLDRFDAAAAAGFGAVEFLFPYDYPVEQVAERVTRNGLAVVLMNLPAGDWDAGERGMAAIPARAEYGLEAVERATPYI